MLAQRPCVIPSVAEGPRIFLDAGRRTLNRGATSVLWTEQFEQWFCRKRASSKNIT
jgi:hypothetical protein